MITLELTDENAVVLRDVLINDLSDLRMEVSHTDNGKFREELKSREEVLKEVLHTLGWDRRF